MTSLHPLLVLKRRWPVLLLLPLVGLAAGALLAPRGAARTAPAFEATVLIAVDQAAIGTTEVQQDLVQATDGTVAARVAEALGAGATARSIGARLAPTFDEENFVVSLVARGADPAAADALAAAYAEAFVGLGNQGATPAQAEAIAEATAARDLAAGLLDEVVAATAAVPAGAIPSPELAARARALEADRAAEESALADLQTQVRPTDLYELIDVGPATAARTGKLTVLDQAPLRAALGAALGLLGAVVLVLVLERTNPRVDDPARAEALVGAPVLAMVPMLRRRRRHLLGRVDPEEFRGPFAEAFRSMRAHLDFRAQLEGFEQRPRLLVTSAAPAEGKSTTAAFLAMAFAQSGRPPVVVGADLRRPSVHRLFGITRTPGLTSRNAVDGADLLLAEIVHVDPVTGIAVVPSGPSTDQVDDVVDDVRAITAVGQQSDRVVIVDTAPVRVANDAVDFLPTVDWVIVVVRIGRSSARSIAQMMQTLRLNGAEVAGVVLIGSVESSEAERYYHSYYASEATSRRARRQQARADGPTSSAGPAVPSTPRPARPVGVLDELATLAD